MLPIIRRRRFPLLPADPPAAPPIAPAPSLAPRGTEDSPNNSVPCTPEPQPLHPLPHRGRGQGEGAAGDREVHGGACQAGAVEVAGAITPGRDSQIVETARQSDQGDSSAIRSSPEIENRADSVQFCSIPSNPVVQSPTLEAPPPQIEHPISSIKSPTCSASHPASCPVDPASTIQRPASENSPSLWSRRPDEPAEAYRLLAAWLEMPVPRPTRKAAAAALHCSPSRLRGLAARHDWKTRTAAFDNHRANAASEALDQLLREERLDLQERAERFRVQEWRLHEEILQAAFAAARQFRQHPRHASLGDLARLCDLVSILGRRAAGLPLEPGATPPEPPPLPTDWETALRKVYGPKIDADTQNDSGELSTPDSATGPVPR